VSLIQTAQLLILAPRCMKQVAQRERRVFLGGEKRSRQNDIADIAAGDAEALRQLGPIHIAGDRYAGRHVYLPDPLAIFRFRHGKVDDEVQRRRNASSRFIFRFVERMTAPSNTLPSAAAGSRLDVRVAVVRVLHLRALAK
jgi:hypothetical protein